MTQLREPALLGTEFPSPQALLDRPLLPDFEQIAERRLDEVFERYGRVGPGCRVVELACGHARWLPYLGRAYGAIVVGLEPDGEAARFAIANLMGMGVQGSIRCCDPFQPAVDSDLLWSFDLVYSLGALPAHEPVGHLRVLRRYLAHDGRILTTVPNAEGLGRALARISGRPQRPDPRFTRSGLRELHERAGFRTIHCGYLGFHDERRLAPSPADAAAWRRTLHGLTRVTASAPAAAWIRLGLGPVETRWLAPDVIYVGERP